jgi:hypothetical protein
MSATNGDIAGPEFGTPEKILAVCSAMQDIEDIHAHDRAKINTLFNGQQPYTNEEIKKFNIQIAVNWGEGKRIMQDANRQLDNALLHPGLLFNCALESGKVEKRDEWSLAFTKNLHIPLQRGRTGKRHHYLIKSRNASVCMHGPGVIMWPSQWRWLGRFVPLEDFLVPTDTYCDFSNDRYFAINLYLTPGEFMSITQGDKTDKGWNVEMARKILDSQKGKYNDTTPSTWRNQPEEMAEVWKQNQGWYWNDAIPKIKLRAFYYQEVDEPNRWYRHIVLREAYDNVDINQFLYNGSGKVFSDHIDHILNIQYGDGSLVAPLKYHSVRGLGVDLYAPVDTLNRLRCEFVQSIFEHLKMYFKIKDPADRDRAKKQVLQQYGFIEEGFEIVKREERNQIDPNLVQAGMAQMRQIMQESAAAFVQDANDGTNKEMTKFEAQARLNMANMMISAMLQSMYVQEAFYYEELVRRFCHEDATDPAVQKFQKQCLEDGIPKNLLHDHSVWRVMPERVLGGGDRTLAQAQSQWINENLQQLDPESQIKAKRIVWSTMLDDPAKANLLVPSAPVQATDGTYAAENVFGTLMQGVQCAMRQGIDQQGYITTLLRMMQSVIQKIQQTGGVGTLDELIGLQVTAQNIGQHLAVLAQDEQQKQLVKQLADVLGRLMNEVKAFAQRFMESQKQQGQQQGGDPAAQAKAQSTVMMAQVKAQINAQNAALKRQQKQLDFELEQQRRNLETLSTIKREDLKAHRDLLNQSAENSLNLMHSARSNRLEQRRMENTLDTATE